MYKILNIKYKILDFVVISDVVCSICFTENKKTKYLTMSTTPTDGFQAAISDKSLIELLNDSTEDIDLKKVEEDLNEYQKYLIDDLDGIKIYETYDEYGGINLLFNSIKHCKSKKTKQLVKLALYILGLKEEQLYAVKDFIGKSLLQIDIPISQFEKDFINKSMIENEYIS